MEKMTNSKALEFVLANCEMTDEVREKITNIKASIDKKNSSKSNKPSARQLENANLTKVIYDTIKGCEPMTVSDIIKNVPQLSGLSTQRVRPMLKSELFSNETVKGKSLYKAI